MMSVHRVQTLQLRASRSDFDPRARPLKPRVGVVKSLALIGAGPVGLIRTQKSHFFKTKNPLRRSKAPLLRADVHFPARVTPRPSSRARAALGRDRDRRCRSEE